MSTFVHSTSAMLANSQHSIRWPLRCLIATNIIGWQIYCNSPKNLLTQPGVQESRSSDACTAQICTRTQKLEKMLHTYIHTYIQGYVQKMFAGNICWMDTYAYIYIYMYINICTCGGDFDRNMKLWFYRPQTHTQTVSQCNCKIST